MNNPKDGGADEIKTAYYFGILIVVLSFAVCSSLVWNAREGRRQVLSMARIQARAAHQRDVIYPPILTSKRRTAMSRPYRVWS
jgi:hypothetical protein